jgi:3-oxoacyl-[acyl-carrier-protein] synthase-1
MNTMPLAIRRTGLVTAVGLDAPSACAALRAKLTNPTETRFADAAGQWLMAHQFPLDSPWRGLERLAQSCAMAIAECLADVPRADWARIPVLLNLAEPERPGRLPGLEDRLFALIEAELGVSFHAESALIAHGRVSTILGLATARKLLHGSAIERVVLAAADSLVHGPTLKAFDRAGRLLKASNTNGWMPGEAAGAVLLTRPVDGEPELRCIGLGMATEAATIDSELPLRGDGLTKAIRNALDEAGLDMHHMDFRLADLAGEQYYFKEASLAMARTLVQRKAFFDLWHPAEGTGEIGAASGLAMLAVMDAACRKGYAPGPRAVAHFANDRGPRAAAILEFASAG